MRSIVKILPHFWQRDFRDTQFLWILLGLFSVTLVFVPIGLQNRLLGFIYLFGIFPVLAVQNIMGTKLRSQLYLSNFYLHSLPIRRAQMFWIMQARLFMYWLPAFALSIYLAMKLGFIVEAAIGIQALELIYLALAVALFFNNIHFTNNFMRLYLDRSLSQQSLILRMGFTLALILIEFFVVISPLAMPFWGLRAEPFFAASVIYLFYQTYRARLAWIECRT